MGEVRKGGRGRGRKEGRRETGEGGGNTPEGSGHGPPLLAMQRSKGILASNSTSPAREGGRGGGQGGGQGRGREGKDLGDRKRGGGVGVKRKSTRKGIGGVYWEKGRKARRKR